MFAHLNVHSKASMLYGSADHKELISCCKKNGQTAIALTDYSNLFNAIHFYKAAKAAGIKPVLGVDVFFCENAAQFRLQNSRQVTHLILLAENDIGFKNIARIVSASYTPDYFYYRPRVDFDLLEKHKDGVICLSGSSLDGTISFSCYDKKNEEGEVSEKAALFKAEGLVRRFMKIYDSNHFYLEVQNHGLDDQGQINDRLRVIAQKYGLRTIATNNVHYVNQSDAEAHRTLLSMDGNNYNKSTLSDFSVEEYYLKNDDQIDLLPDELELAGTVADRCNVTIDTKQRRLPKYQFVPEGMTAMEYLRELANRGMNKLGIVADQVVGTESYKHRLDRELADIEDMGFADYFLIVHDVVSWARDQGILIGRGRGSAGGSMVSYSLGITEIDPLEYSLIWERFLNKGRGGLPDIDTDFPRSKRQDVLNYIKARFGANNVAQLVTLSGLQARAILKEVFRVFDLSFDEANKITALIPAKNEEHGDISIEEAIERVPELKAYYDKYTPWFKIAISLEGCYKSTGIHPAAVVIADTPFEESFYPLTKSKSGDQIFAWDMETVDTLSLLKLDILGLTTLDDVQVTTDLVRERRGINLTRQTIPLDDPTTWAMISQGLTAGIFQIEKQLGKTWSKALKPNNIRELSDVISLIRPATLETGLTKQYKDTKEGIIPFSPAHPLLADIVRDSYGVLAYQEQTIFACQVLAGFTLAESDSIRRVIGKKKPDELKTWKPKFVDGCVKNNISSEDAEEIWNQLEKFAGYQFNLSHGVGYALLAYETAYLKANYPVEFFCAKLRHTESHPDSAEQLASLIYDSKLFNIEILPPRLKNGKRDFTVLDDKRITFGLSALHGVGKAAITDLLKVANDCESFEVFLWKVLTTKNKINSGVVLALIRSGAFDDEGIQRVECQRRFKLFEALTDNEKETIGKLCFLLAGKEPVDWIRVIRAIADENKIEAIKTKYNIKIPNIRRRSTIRELLAEFDSSELFDSKAQKIAWEQHYLGISLSGSEADIYNARNTCIELVKDSYPDMPFEIAVCVDSTRNIITKKGDPMAFVTARDTTYKMDNIVVFPRVFNTSKGLLEPGSVLKIRGKVDDRGSLIANFIERLK